MIIYFGNILSKHGFNRTTIEDLGLKLSEYYQVNLYSSFKNPIIRLFDMLFALLSKKKLIKLILIDTYSTKAFYYAFILGLLSKLLNIPFIPILHGGNLYARYKKTSALTLNFFNNASMIISPSQYLINRFKPLGFEIVHIPNFIDTKQYTFRHRKKVNPNILWVRSFDKIYNPQMAIYVMKKLITKHAKATITMIGPEKDGTQKLCKELCKTLNMENQVIFTGALSKNEWIKLSNNADIFLNTSNIDNLPVSVIEAMALGLPIVSTNVGGIPYFLKNNSNALLVDANDISCTVKNINRILDDPKLSSHLSYNGRISAKEFDWNRVSKKWRKSINKFL